ncbi:MAG: cell division protein FtsA [Gammaproteobacteria bacterium]|nr:MAG: cell division protein FtsA [Gammaproteobacteria bacterium]
MKNSDIVAAIDIGSAHIIAALAAISPTGAITPLAFAEIPSKGVKKGGIANIGLAQHAVDTVLEALQIDGSYHIHSIVASLSGVSIVGHNSDGSVAIRGTPVCEEDVQRAISVAKNVALQEGRQLLHILRQSFILDRQTDIDDPIDLMGERLTVRVHIISAAKTAYYNLLQVFSHRDIDVEHVVASGLASMLSVTSHDERQLGVCVLDIGAGTTDVTIIHNGQVKHTEVIQLGGELITNDIAFFMRSTAENAEAIKCQIDICATYDEDDIIEIPSVGDVARRYTTQDVANVARDRCEQLIEMIMQKIRRSGVEDIFPGGFVITGGSANLTGIEQLFMEKTQLPVRIAKVEVALPDSTQTSSRYATIMGLFLCAYEEDYTRTMTNELKTGIISRLSTGLRDLWQKVLKHF